MYYPRYGGIFIGKELQTLNGQNKLALWAERISECRNSGQNAGLSRILCKRSPRVQTAETGMSRQRSDKCRLFSTITPTVPDVKGGEAGLQSDLIQKGKLRLKQKEDSREPLVV